MAIKVGISGFGRIARVVIRAAMDMPEIEIAGINVRMQILSIWYTCSSTTRLSEGSQKIWVFMTEDLS